MANWVNRVRKQNETWQEKQESQYNWAVEARIAGPHVPAYEYTSEEFGVEHISMGELVRGFGRGKEFTKVIRLKEAVARHEAGLNDQRENYIGAAIKLWAELCEEATNEYETDGLTGEFFGREIEDREESSTYTATGTQNEKGEYYLSYWRIYVPYELFLILEKVQKLKRAWQSRSSKEGDHLNDMQERNEKITQVRKLWKSNGTAQEMAAEFHLPGSLADKLPTSFSSKPGKVKKDDETPKPPKVEKEPKEPKEPRKPRKPKAPVKLTLWQNIKKWIKNLFN